MDFPLNLGSLGNQQNEIVKLFLEHLFRNAK